MVCNRREAAKKKAVKAMLLDHKIIMEDEAGKRDGLEYNVDNDNNNNESKEESKEESESGDESEE